jgi:hypothetical protein
MTNHEILIRIGCYLLGILVGAFMQWAFPLWKDNDE